MPPQDGTEGGHAHQAVSFQTAPYTLSDAQTRTVLCYLTDWPGQGMWMVEDLTDKPEKNFILDVTTDLQYIE